MESEKVKEIKEKLQEEIFIANSFGDKLRKVPTKELENLLTLITELESENAALKKYKLDWLNGEKMHLQAEMEETEFELASSNRLFETVSKENKQLKDRIAELESENERLQKKNYQLEQDLGQCENRYKLELHTARYQMQSVNENLKKAQDRIAELEFELSKKRLEINALKCGKEIAEGVIEVVEKEETKLSLKQFAKRLKKVIHERDYVEGYAYLGICEEIDETLKEFLK